MIILGLTACGTGSQPDPNPTVMDANTMSDDTALPVTTSHSKYNEAPVLAAQVEAGELPPVDERLPENPRVIPVYDEIGQYGGTWRRVYTGLGDRVGPTKLIEERIIEFYMPDVQTLLLEPNWADRFEANADSSEFTVHIREGLRWSDGVEVTTEDVRFWFEDVLLNEHFFPTMPGNLIINEQPVNIEILDTYTFRIIFAGSYPLFPTLVARATPGAIGLQGTSFILPFHYLKDFHPTYTAQAELNTLAEEYGVENWIDLWGDGPVQAWWLNPDLPILGAWTMVIPPPADPIVMERNPYYHAVDAEGNQLPYIDRIVHSLAADSDVVALWIVQGLIDLQNRHVSTARFDLFKRNEEQGDYQVVTWISGGTEALYPNLNTSDEVLAALFANIKFRQALSVAIDREEILEVVFNGLGEVRQASPVSGSPQFDADFETKWTAYDPALANRLLDEIGLVERDSQGFRLRPDGNRLTITISARGSEGILDMVTEQWAEIGIEVRVEILERLEYEAHAESGDVQMGVWDFDRNVVIAADPGRYLGTTTDGPWAPLYAQWYASGGESGIEPPADHPIRDIWAAWENAKSASTIEEANMFVQEIVNIHKENVWVIGVVGEEPSLYIVRNNVGNFPEGLIHETALRDIGLAMPVQFYFRQ